MTKRFATGTILLTGLSASGKTTLGRRLRDDLLASGVPKVELLDGEDVRARFRARGREFGFSPEERRELALEIAAMARDLNRQGSVVVVGAIVHRRATRAEMREVVGDLLEIHLDCPADVCEKRDYKDQYGRARAGLIAHFVGVTEPYEASERVDLRVPTHAWPVERCAKEILDRTLEFLRPRVEV